MVQAQSFLDNNVQSHVYDNVAHLDSLDFHPTEIFLRLHMDPSS